MSENKASSKIITFYSYKGGAGRSMALANVAWILASNGKRVLTVDWDLEAPGLHRYYMPFLEPIPKLASALCEPVCFVLVEQNNGSQTHSENNMAYSR
jgi:MinD superfamily P-loop ATPase